MSRCTSRSEWLSYWCLALAAAVGVCLVGNTNRAEVKLIPAHPGASGPALPAEPAGPHEDSTRAAIRSLVDQALASGRHWAAQLSAPFTAVTNPIARRTSDDREPSGDRPATGAAPASPASPPSAGVELTPELAALRDKVRKALAMYYPRHQNSRDNNAWEIMHAIIAYGVDTRIYKDGPGGEKVNAIGWLCYNYPCAGERMLFLNNGKLEARRGVGVQGHYGQFLAILAQSHLKSDYPMFVSGKQFTLADLIEHEKENCVAGEELTFKLIALMHYLDSDATWKSRDGQDWSIQRLIREELAQPIRGAACGGTHRLMGFSYAVNKRLQRGQPVVGEFKRAQIFINDYHRYTFGLQNPDGSFSTEWFVRKGSDPSIDRRLKTSGHILEWIGFSLSDQELRDPRMIKAVDYIATLLLTHDRHTWEIGPLGHGLHALVIYDARVFKPADPPRPAAIVETSSDVDGAAEARRETPSAQ
jgi:hypothetical protein